VVYPAARFIGPATDVTGVSGIVRTLDDRGMQLLQVPRHLWAGNDRHRSCPDLSRVGLVVGALETPSDIEDRLSWGEHRVQEDGRRYGDRITEHDDSGVRVDHLHRRTGQGGDGSAVESIGRSEPYERAVDRRIGRKAVKGSQDGVVCDKGCTAEEAACLIVYGADVGQRRI
jgi:hypothetical protein